MEFISAAGKSVLSPGVSSGISVGETIGAAVGTEEDTPVSPVGAGDGSGFPPVPQEARERSMIIVRMIVIILFMVERPFSLFLMRNAEFGMRNYEEKP